VGFGMSDEDAQDKGDWRLKIKNSRCNRLTQVHLEMTVKIVSCAHIILYNITER